MERRNAAAVDSLLVKVTTNDGLCGYGETETFDLGSVSRAKCAIDHMGIAYPKGTLRERRPGIKETAVQRDRRYDSNDDAFVSL